MRILIVEDEPKTAEYLRQGLAEQGYAVAVAEDGIDGQHLALHHDFDLIVLDIMLPGLDGFAVLAALRSIKSTPVLMLTARDSMDDRVRGLREGADDYLVKPFSFMELLARVQALSRRGRMQEPLLLRVGDLQIDLIARKVTRHGQQLLLHGKHALHARQVEAQVRELLDTTQAFHVALRVAARVLGGALRLYQPAPLIQPQRLRMHAGQLGRHRDHEQRPVPVVAREHAQLATRGSGSTVASCSKSFF